MVKIYRLISMLLSQTILEKKIHPTCEQPKSDLYDADYIILLTTINRARSHLQIKMARAAIDAFKTRYSKTKDKGEVKYNVDVLVRKCKEKKLLLKKIFNS